ncbi:MAG: hypothetical protein ABJJ53_15195 [Sulfitobacter sp.]
MINIYARTLMNATRTGEIRLQDIPSVPQSKRHRWFFRRKPILKNTKNL